MLRVMNEALGVVYLEIFLAHLGLYREEGYDKVFHGIKLLVLYIVFCNLFFEDSPCCMPVS